MADAADVITASQRSVLTNLAPVVAETCYLAGGVDVASLDDLACMKLSAIAGRGAARDFWDLHAMIKATAKSLADYLTAFGRKYPTEDQGHLVRSLVYFGDAEAAPLPRGMTVAAWHRIRTDFEVWVQALVTPLPV